MTHPPRPKPECAELRPCPFCGGNDLSIHEGAFEFWVLCETCKATSGASSERDVALRDWNRRGDPAQEVPGPTDADHAKALETLKLHDIASYADLWREIENGVLYNEGHYAVQVGHLTLDSEVLLDLFPSPQKVEGDATIELAYGLLWIVGCNRSTPNGNALYLARKALYERLDRKGQARGITAARTALEGSPLVQDTDQ